MRLFQHKNGTYYAELSRTKRISLKTKDKAQAQRLYRKLRAEALAQRLYILEGRPPAITLSTFFDEYLEHSFTTKAKFTYQTDGVAIRQFLQTFPGNLELSQITNKAVEKWHGALKARVKPVSANTWFRHIKAAFSKAVFWKYLKENPCAGIKIKDPESEDRYLTAQEIDSIISAEQDLSWRLLWLFMVETGVRRSEALRVRVPVDEKGYIPIKAKGGKIKRVYLTDAVRNILAQHPVQVGTLWHWKPDTVSQHFADTCKKVGIKARVHDLRHTYASNMAMAGVDLRVVQRLMGHSDFKTTQRYEHLTPEFLEQVLAEKSRKEEKSGA